MSLTHQAVHAFKWSLLGEIGSRAIGPLVFLLLARLLVPEDFGVVAAATVVISFSQVFSDAGLAKALIQRQDRREESANVVFWVNLGIGFLIVAFLLFAAPFIASFFHDKRIAPVVRILSLQILLAAFSSVHTAMLQKDLNFKQLFWVRLVATGVPGLASIPLALHGMGYWAIVAGALLGQAMQSIVLWIRNPWRPRWGLDIGLARELIAFGKWAMLSGLMNWLYGWVDAILVGHYLGAHDMGLYRTGTALVTMIFGLFFTPLLPVLYSLFSRVQHDLPKLRDTLGTVAHTSALIGMPVGFCLFALNKPIADALFGSHWQGIGQVIGFMGLIHGLTWMVGANGEVYRAMGKPHVETWTNGILLVFFLIGYLVSIRYGLRVFLEVSLALNIFSVGGHMLVAYYVLGMPIRRWIFSGALAASILPAFVVSQLSTKMEFALVNLIFMGLIFVGTSLAAMAVFERTFLKRLRLIVWPGRALNIDAT